MRLCRNVPPANGYRVRRDSDGLKSGSLTVHSEQAAPWNPGIYNQSIPDNGYGYLTTRDGTKLAIDLLAQTVTMPGGGVERFEIDPFRKECLLAGIDEIELTLRYETAIAAYERRQREDTPWLSPR